MPKADNSKHLVLAASVRRSATQERAQEALNRCQKQGQLGSVSSFLTLANVSRAWLYSNEQKALLDQVKALVDPTRRPQSTRPNGSSTPPASEASNRNRIEVLVQRNRTLGAEIGDLREALATAHGEIRALRGSRCEHCS